MSNEKPETIGETVSNDRYQQSKRLDALEKQTAELRREIKEINRKLEVAFSGMAGEVRPMFNLGSMAALFDAAAAMFRRDE